VPVLQGLYVMKRIFKETKGQNWKSLAEEKKFIFLPKVPGMFYICLDCTERNAT